MRTLLSKLIMPVPVFWILTGIGIFFYYSGEHNYAINLLFVSALFLYLISSPFLIDTIIKNIENRYPTIEIENLTGKNSKIHILVLGNEQSENADLPAIDQISVTALARLSEGIRLHRAIPGSLLITSGRIGNKGKNHAVLMAEAAIMLGVERENIRIQKEPVNTWLEAIEYKQIHGNQEGLIIVTSALHMPRAMYLFRKAGLSPQPASANHTIIRKKRIFLENFIPSGEALVKSEMIIHETIGFLYGYLFLLKNKTFLKFAPYRFQKNSYHRLSPDTARIE